MILKNERDGTDFTVPPEGVRLGRDPSLEIVVPETEDVVSGTHCRVVRRDDESWWLEDLGSTNGTWLNGQRLTEPARLQAGMKFSLGQRGPVLKVSIPGQVARTQAEPAINLGLPQLRLRRVKGGEDLVAAGMEIVLGRSASCQLPLRTVADTVVSKRHAKITFDESGNAFLSDLESRNGTYLNGEAVKSRESLRPGDRVMLGWQGPMFEVRQLGSHALGEGEGAAYAPEREPRRSLGGMVAVAEGEARGSKRMRTGVFVKALARQIATESSPGLRAGLVIAFMVLIGAVFLLWRQGIERAAQNDARILQAEARMAEHDRRADSVQQAASLQLAGLRAELDAARRNAVSRQVVDSLERQLRAQEALARVNPGAPAAASATPFDFTAVARDNSRAVGLVIVRFGADSSMGSGFVITPSGFMVTCRHVISEGREPRQVVVVMAESNVVLPADVVSISTASNQDIAVLKIRNYRGGVVRAIDWLGSGAQQGAQAAVLGFPFGTRLALDQSGMVHSTIFGGLIAGVGDWIRFSGSTYGGVSGSPVFNASGEVISVHFGAATEGTGLGVSVPMSKVRRWLPAEARAELGL